MTAPATNHSNGNGPAQMETHIPSLHTAERNTPTSWHPHSPPIAQKLCPHNVNATPLGVHIDKVSVAKNDGINLLLQPSPTLPHAYARIASTGCSDKTKSSPQTSQQPIQPITPSLTNPLTANHQSFSNISTHIYQRRC